ncbi:MAG: hypothetical protein SGJ24_05810 [Chloroflexota bacterium]|nr:hypothetical protein [Chloroflexota bacterium]
MRCAVDLADCLSYTAGALHIDKPGHADGAYGLNGDGLVLTPSAFKSSLNGLSYQIVPEFMPMLIYSARGGGNWYTETRIDPESQLRIAFGDAPARMLLALSQPDHTSSLALRLFLTAGAVSQQLKRLHQAGLVVSQRIGHKVYYRLSERGAKLVGLFS